jgi:hypothetical protein
LLSWRCDVQSNLSISPPNNRRPVRRGQVGSAIPGLLPKLIRVWDGIYPSDETKPCHQTAIAKVAQLLSGAPDVRLFLECAAPAPMTCKKSSDLSPVSRSWDEHSGRPTTLLAHELAPGATTRCFVRFRGQGSNTRNAAASQGAMLSNDKRAFLFRGNRIV